MPTKTKYVKVPVSERLPELEGYCSVIFKDSDTIRDYYHAKNVLSENFWKIHIEYWLEEVPDHEEDLLFALANFDEILLKLEWPDEITEEIMQYRAYYLDLQYRINENKTDES